MKVKVAALSDLCCLFCSRQFLPEVQRAPNGSVETGARSLFLLRTLAQLPILSGSQVGHACQWRVQPRKFTLGTAAREARRNSLRSS